MKQSAATRALARGLCVAVVASVVGAAPAFAEEPQSDQLWISAPYEATLPVGAGGAAGPERLVEVGLSHDNGNFAVTDGRITVDVSGLAGVAEVTWPDNCAPTGTTAVCTVPSVALSGDTGERVRLQVRAAAGAAAGATGRIAYTARAATNQPGVGELVAHEAETPVTLGSGPDLVVRGTVPSGEIRPGDSVSVPFSVVNEGGEAARGVRVTLYVTRGLDVGAVDPHCTTTPLDGTDGYVPLSRVDCAFDDVIEPGGTFRLPAVLTAKAAPYAFHERLDVTVEPGGGAQDLSPYDNGLYGAVRVANTSDFAVRGADVAAAAGESVTVGLTFQNKGPGWVANLRSGDPVGSVDFVVPRGATVTRAPGNCFGLTLDGDWYEGPAGAPRYRCELPMWVGEKQTVTFPFTLRVDTVVPDATGTLTLRGGWGEARPTDPEPKNDTAKLVLNAAG
ncbi:hypothetical protein [Streptomyces sp. enrichment culture]|uniref:hypothetical protein n=1 Tax=Streptomyces sp. enrichment culture TaxID=1795815 RepID=UPI003F554B94